MGQNARVNSRARSWIGVAFVSVTLSIGAAGCSEPEPDGGTVLGSWDLEVQTAANPDSHSWGASATVREQVADFGGAILRDVIVPITVAPSQGDGWFEPSATITWANGREEACDSNGGLRNRLYFRPNGGNDVLTQVSFNCGILDEPVGDPGSGAYVTVTP